MEKILSYISKKVRASTTEYDKIKIKNFAKVRKTMINLLMKDDAKTALKMLPHTLIITLFGCGKWRYGPGTLASFVTLLLWFFITKLFFELDVKTANEFVFWMIICACLFIHGILFIPLYSKKFESEDHPSIVVDEVVGQLLALALTYPFVKQYYFEENSFISNIIMFGHIFSCFIFFRFLDIAKPLFIGTIDRKIKNSFGVMLDDAVCGILTAAINITIFLIYEKALISLHSSYIN